MQIRRTFAAVLLAVCLGALSAAGALAQSGQNAQSFTLQPGGRATVTFQAFCTDFGKKFPQSIQAPNAVASNQIPGALAYIQSNNLAADQNKALEAQYAIWQLSGATGSPAGGADAQAVVKAAATPPATPQGTSLSDAAKANQVSVTVGSWQALGTPVQLGAATDNFYGQGSLTVTNNTQQALTLYLPVGALFPPATAGDQTMAGYTTNVQVSNPQPTPRPTSAPAQGQSQQPNQLPNTGEGNSSASWILAVFAIAVISIGYAIHQRLHQR